MMKKLLLVPVFAFPLACGGSETTAPATPPTLPESSTSSAPPSTTTAAAPASEPAKTEAPKETSAPAAPKPAVVWKDMATPESVLYDEANDRYLVSNINGKPLDVDNNGFISELSPDGKVTKLKFIEGGGKVTLNAPKGTAIVKGVLYVADIDNVRMFDAKSGAAKGSVAVAGAKFLNDMVATPDGRIFVSDSGLKQGASDFEPTGTDAIYLIQGNAAKLVIKGDLNRPNGLLWFKDGLYVNTFGAATISHVNPEYVSKLWAGVSGPKKEDPTKKFPLLTDVTTVPAAALDGLAIAGDSILVSSWASKTIYKGTLGGKFEAVVQGVNAPADIGYDVKRKRVLVPRFMDSVVEAYDLP